LFCSHCLPWPGDGWWVVGGVVWGLGPWPRPLPVAPVIVA